MSPIEIIAHLDELIAKSSPEARAPLASLLSARVTQLMIDCIEEKAEQGPGEDQLLSVSEAAKRMSISERWLYGNANKLPFVVKVGGRLRFSTKGLEAWLKRRQGRS